MARFLLVAVGFLSAALGAESFSANVTAGDSTWVLAVQTCSGATVHTLHGLWPNFGESCGGEAFSEDAVASIRDQMDTYWLSCPGFGNSNVQFWTHEWSKHGSCSKMDQLTYFSTALQLRAKYAQTCTEATCDICLAQNLVPC